MKFELSCEQYSRLYPAALQIDEKSAIANRDFMRSIRLEHKNGKSLMVATCGSILACECLGETDEPDCAINLKLDEKLRRQCVAEIQFDSKLHITFDLASGWIAAQTTLGYSHTANLNTGFDWEFENIDDWRQIVAVGTKPRKSSGAIAVEADWLIRLTETSPSKSIVFPERFDTQQALIITDLNDPNWFGLFLANKRAQKSSSATQLNWFEA